MFAGKTKQTAYIVTIVLTVLLALVCIRGVLSPNLTYEYTGQHEFAAGIATENTVIFDQIGLKPGMYYVELDYAAEVFGAAHCTLSDGTVFTGGLLTNGEHLHRNLNKTGFHMWLFEETENLQVLVSHSGNGSLQTGRILFSQTDGLWTMLLTVVLFLGGLVLLALYYHFTLRKRLSAAQKTVIWGICTITLVASYFQLTGAGLGSIDLTYHYMRIEGVKDGFLSGQLPVRIEPEWLFGQGFACGIFYCNLFLVFPAMLRLLGFTVVSACNIFFVASNLATAYIAYVCFRKMFCSYQIGLLCSALYTLSVFRVYKLYITGDIGEGLAFTFFPLILYGFFRAFTEDVRSKNYKTVWIPLMLGYAGVLQSHLLTCIIVGFLTVVLCVIAIRKILVKETFWELAKGASGAIALSLWYLVPFLDYYLTQDVHIKNLTARTIQFRGLVPAQLLFHFWRQGSMTPMGDNGMQYSYPVGVGFVLTAGLVLFLILWFYAFPGLKGEKGVLRYAKTSALLTLLLLCMSLNVFPWDRLQGLSELTAPFISSLEFPSRVIGVATALLMLPIGFSLWYFQKTEQKKYISLCIWVAVIGLATSTVYMCDRVYQDGNTFKVYNEEGMGFGFVSDGEYLMEGTPASRLEYELPVVSEQAVLHRYEKEYLEVKMECENRSSEQEAYVDLPILRYRDYKAYTDAGEELEITYNEKMQIRVLLPEGFRGEVMVSFVPPLYWRISEGISVAAAVGLSLFGGICWQKRRKYHGKA